MQDIHHQYYSRLAIAIARMAKEPDSGLNEERRQALEQLVKTVLLAEASPRLRQAGLTIERLVQLNAVDVEGETFRGQVLVAETDLLALSQRVPDLQIAGQGKTALVRYVLGRVSLGEILGRARSKVDNLSQRFNVFWGALRHSLGVAENRGFEEGGSNDGELELIWRRTKRRGRIKLGNIREMSYNDFTAPDGAFTVLVNYPWDEPGHSVDEARLRAGSVRRKQGLIYTVCWLPRHMTPSELGVLTELAAVRYLLSDAGQEDLLETLGPQDRGKVLDQAGIRQKTLESRLDELLREVYVDHGEFYALISDVDSSRPRKKLSENLEHIATLLMDRRYPQHPTFLAEPKKQDLETLLGWMVDAAESSTSVAYDEPVGRVLQTLGQPLELVNLGQTKASLRLDSRYVKDVLQRADQESISWTVIADHLRETYGFQPLVVDLFLCFLCQRNHRALLDVNGDPIEVRIGMSQTIRIRLQRGELVSPAGWHRLRDLGDQLFNASRPPAHLSLQGQDKFATSLRENGQRKRALLQGLHIRLVHLGVEEGQRLKELSTANTRLAPLVQSTTDSYKVLTELLAVWPDEDSPDPLRAVVQQAESILEALDELNENVWSNLKSGLRHPAMGEEILDHLNALQRRLEAAQAEQPLKKELISKWNTDAQRLVKRLIEQRAPTPPPVQPPPSNPFPPIAPRLVLLEARLNPGDTDAISRFLAQAHKALTEQVTTPIRVALVRKEETE
jgi:2'-5' RNA ligase